jgi:hypothetical protein
MLPVAARRSSCFPKRLSAAIPKDSILAVFGEETIGIAELDRRLIARAKFDLDVAGHYARPDVFRLTVNSGELTSVEFQPILNGNSLKEAAP